MRKLWLILFLLCACSMPEQAPVQEEPAASGQVYACDEQCLEPEGSREETFFTPASFEDFLQAAADGESGFYYFGFEDCPWCRQFVPVLEEVLDDQDVYYVMTRDENHELLYTPEQKERALSIMEGAMPLNEEGEPTLYVPLLVRLDYGEVTAFHQGTLEGHDAREQELSQSQKEELADRIREVLEAG